MKAVRQARLEPSGGSTPDQLKPPQGGALWLPRETIARWGGLQGAGGGGGGNVFAMERSVLGPHMCGRGLS